MQNCARASVISMMLMVGLAACVHVPISSLYRLRNVDMVTTDAEQFRIAVRVPADIRVPASGVRFLLGSTHQQRENLSGEFILQPADEPEFLGEIEDGGTTARAFRIAPKDIERFNRLRHKIRIEKEYGADGVLEVEADVCRTTAAMPSRIRLSTYLKAVETDGYVALLRNVNVLKGIDNDAAATRVPLCSADET